MTRDDIDHRELHALVDDELDLARRLEIEQRLVDEPQLRRGIDDLRELRTRLRDHVDYHRAPDALRAALTSAEPVARPVAPTIAERIARWSWRPWGASLTAAVAVAVVTAFGLQWIASRSTDARLRGDVMASHVRSTIGDRLVDVASSDHHTVKPWLSARLDFSPPVRDDDIGGATFVGARVDYLDGHRVAALVYRKGNHTIDDFVWPTSDGSHDITYATEHGFQLAHWSKDGMTHWAISDVNRAEFGDFVRAIADEAGRR